MKKLKKIPKKLINSIKEKHFKVSMIVMLRYKQYDPSWKKENFIEGNIHTDEKSIVDTMAQSCNKTVLFYHNLCTNMTFSE